MRVKAAKAQALKKNTKAMPPTLAPQISRKKAVIEKKAPASAPTSLAKKSSKPAPRALKGSSKPDEKMIKKPVNSFIYFAKVDRLEVVAANPNFKNSEVLSKCGEHWKEMTDSQKKPYLLLAEKDRNRYHTEKEL